MKISLPIACLVCAFAVSSFAQSAPNKSAAEDGAQLVAQHDATWHRQHAQDQMAIEPMTHHKLGHTKHVKHAKQHARTQHVKHRGHAKRKVKETV